MEVQSQQLLGARRRPVKEMKWGVVVQSLVGHPLRTLKLRRLVNDEVEKRRNHLGFFGEWVPRRVACGISE